MNPSPVALLALASLTGCLVQVAEAPSDEWEVAAARSDAAGLRRATRQRLSRLSVGMTRAQVDKVVGTNATWLGQRMGFVDKPFRTRTYIDQDGAHVDVLYYYTDLRAQDQKIAADELTPVVLVDGKVTGWGQDFAVPEPGG